MARRLLVRCATCLPDFGYKLSNAWPHNTRINHLFCFGVPNWASGIISIKSEWNLNKIRINVSDFSYKALGDWFIRFCIRSHLTCRQSKKRRVGTFWSLVCFFDIILTKCNSKLLVKLIWELFSRCISCI